MSTKKNIEFHIQNTWRVAFTCHNADGSVLPIAGGDQVKFRVNQGSTVLFTKTIGDGIVITDGPAGAGMVTITPPEQTAIPILKNKTYSYELQVITATLISTQAEGALKVLPSLFAV